MKVFINYKQNVQPDHELARRLELALNRRRCHVFRDETGLKASDEWPERLEAAIRWCDVMVSLISNASMQSKWVLAEVDLAIRLKKRLFPVLLETLDEGIKFRAFDPRFLNIQYYPAAGDEACDAETVAGMLQATDTVTDDGTKKRVLIVDDHPIVRQGLKGLISEAPDLMVCGEAETIFDALQAIERLKPDVVIVDIWLQRESGIDLVKDIRIRHPDLLVLVLSQYDEAIYAERVLRAGGRGYVTKDEAAENVLQAIRVVLKGQIFLSERMSAKMLSKLVGGKTEAADLSVDRLSDRELQIFQLIGRGTSTRMIAETLHVSIKTIEAHRVNIKEKLQIDSTTELLQHAIHWVQSQG